MAKILFGPPLGPPRELTDVSELKSAVLSYPCDYWLQGGGGASLETVGSDGTKKKLMILPHHNTGRIGIYLRYAIIVNNVHQENWLSLADRTKLDTVAECADEWYASVGLFLPPEAAWEGIEDFILTGEKSSRIEWIQPSELPEGGNW